jgi:hypothetical protein
MCQPGVRERLEASGRAFVRGFNEVLVDGDPSRLVARLSRVDLEYQGFAFEGAAMAFTILDHLAPKLDSRLAIYLGGPAQRHTYVAHVGAGWAIARVPWLRFSPEILLSKLDPLLRWLAVDGYGFHEGYFSSTRSIRRCRVPRGLRGYARRAFDHGLGRSLWFVEGADVDRIAIDIEEFAVSRRADLWSGVALACTYAGGADVADIERLGNATSGYRPQVAQGAAFAAKARERAGNPAAHTELACRVLCGLTAAEAAAVTDRALIGLPGDSAEPAYEVWRQRVGNTFAAGAIVRLTPEKLYKEYPVER